MTLRRRCASAALAFGLVAGAGSAAAAPATTPTGMPAMPAATPTPPPTPTTTPPMPQPTSTIGGAGLLRPGILYDRPAGVPRPPELQAGAYLVADADDGRVILAKNAHLQSRPASTLKTLTALTLASKLPRTQIVAATPEDAAIDGSKVGLWPGEEYTVEQLMLGLLLTSGNDAANALARANGGMAPTAREMTEHAHGMGALDTFAKNTSGLDATGQLTSVYDLALLGRAAIEDPVVGRYLTVKTAEFPGKRTDGPGSRRERYQINSHNKLLWNYDGTIGVKNGYTQAARQTYIGAVRRGDATYVITYLGGTAGGWRDTAALLDWAFAYGDKVKPVGELVDADTFDPEQTPPVAPVEPEATAGASASTAPAFGGIQLSPTSGQGRLALLAGGAAALLAAAAFTWSRLRRR